MSLKRTKTHRQRHRLFLAASEGVIPLLRRTPIPATNSGSALGKDEARSLVPAAGVGSY
jgi:hypothetical protein